MAYRLTCRPGSEDVRGQEHGYVRRDGRATRSRCVLDTRRGIIHGGRYLVPDAPRRGPVVAPSHGGPGRPPRRDPGLARNRVLRRPGRRRASQYPRDPGTPRSERSRARRWRQPAVCGNFAQARRQTIRGEALQRGRRAPELAGVPRGGRAIKEECPRAAAGPTRRSSRPRSLHAGGTSTGPGTPPRQPDHRRDRPRDPAPDEVVKVKSLTTERSG